MALPILSSWISLHARGVGFTFIARAVYLVDWEGALMAIKSSIYRLISGSGLSALDMNSLLLRACQYAVSPSRHLPPIV